MDLIHHNPFRILGLPINASDKDIVKRVSELEAYAAIGKIVHYDTDFLCLSPLNRGIESIREAANRIEALENRLFYTFFWFWQYNSADALALDILKDGNINKSISLLERQLKDDKLTEHTYSTAKNLMCLYLASFNDVDIYPAHLPKCLLWAGRFFESEMLHGYVTWISGNQFSYDRKKLISAFIDDFIKWSIPYAKCAENITAPKLVSMFSSFSPEVQRSIANRFSSTHILNIETNIKAAEKQRKATPEKAYSIGMRLYTTSYDEINGLLGILSNRDVKLQSVTDKLADELLNCSIEFFNYHINLDHEGAFGQKALKLVDIAKSLVIGKKVQLRIEKNRSTMEEFVADWRESQKQQRIKADYDSINKRINALSDVSVLSNSAVNNLKYNVECFLADSIENLSNIKKVVGIEDNDYLFISSTVVSHALNHCVEYIKRINKPGDIASIIYMLADYDMDNETSNRYQGIRTEVLRKLTVAVGKAYCK